MKIAKGTTRIVFLLRKCVLKIPNFLYSWQNFITGICCNMRERDTYRFNSPHKQEMLAAVKWASWGGWIIIMDRADTSRHAKEAANTPADELYQEWIKAGLGGDDKHTNYGYRGDRLVKIDYGS